MPIGLWERERDVGEGGHGSRYILDDHVNVEFGLGQNSKNSSRFPNFVGHPDYRDLSFAAVMRDARNDGLLHGGPILDQGGFDRVGIHNPRALFIRKR